MGEEDLPESPPIGLSQDIDFKKALERFAHEGEPLFSDVLSSMLPYADTIEPHLRLMLFNIVGKYVHVLSSLIRKPNPEWDLNTMFAIAMTEVMTDSRVRERIEGMMRMMTQNVVVGFVQGGE